MKTPCLVVVASLFFPSAAFAAEGKKSVTAAETPIEQPAESSKKSKVRLETYSGKNYRGADLSGSHQLHEDLSLRGGLNSTRYGDNSRVGELRFGATVQVSDSVSVQADVRGRREPNDIRARSIAPGVHWILSDLWSSPLVSDLSFVSEFTRYQQGAAPNLGTDIGDDILQRRYTLGFSQEFSESFLVGVEFSKYQYGSVAEGDRLRRGVNRRPVGQFGNSGGWAQGFAQSSVTLDADWSINEVWSVQSAIGTSRTVGDEIRNRFLQIGTNYSWDSSWTTGVSILGSRASDGQRFGYLSLSAEYRW